MFRSFRLNGYWIILLIDNSNRKLYKKFRFQMVKKNKEGSFMKTKSSIVYSGFPKFSSQSKTLQMLLWHRFLIWGIHLTYKQVDHLKEFEEHENVSFTESNWQHCSSRLDECSLWGGGGGSGPHLSICELHVHYFVSTFRTKVFSL